MKAFVDKYNPQTVKEVEGHNIPLLQLKEIISRKGIALVHGATGVGKTSSIYAIANDLNLEVLELNASDLRNKNSIESVIGAALKQHSLLHSGKLILIDDSKSENLSCDNLFMKISKDVDLEKNIVLKRRLDDNWVCPVSDEMTIDTKKVINELTH